MPDDEIRLEIEDAAPIAALATDAEDEAAELAAADAEIDAEDEVATPDEEADPDETGEGDEEAEGEGKGDESEIDNGEGEEEPEESEDRAHDAPRIELTPDVYARIRECLGTQMAAIEAQIARAERVSDADPFFDRWKTVLLAQRDRLRGQIAGAEAKAPVAAEAAGSPVEEPEPLSA